MIEGTIFDMDGVLLDSMPAWEHAGQRYLNSLGIEAEPDLDKALFPLSMEAGAGYLRTRYPAIDLSEGAIVDGLTKTIENFYISEAALKPGVKEFLMELHKRSIPMTVATSSNRDLAEAALKRNGILEYFSNIFTCSEVGAGKVKPDIYLKAARRMGTTPGKTWVFEDALHAMETAKKAGFYLVGIYDSSSREVQEKIQRICHIYLGNKMDFTYFYSMAAR